MTADIVVLDTGLGNVGSVLNMLHHIGASAKLSRDPKTVAQGRKLILAGVGHFDAGVRALQDSALRSALTEAVTRNGANLLGICLGMQLLFDRSEEGDGQGLGFLPGSVRRFQVEGAGLRVPHMGWNVVTPAKKSRLFELTNEEQRFYFVHSFFVSPSRQEDTAAISNYGTPFAAAVEHENISGVQFHPEKSHRFGMALLSRFAEAA
jgi:glutamine amidotransferase